MNYIMNINNYYEYNYYTRLIIIYSLIINYYYNLKKINYKNIIEN